MARSTNQPIPSIPSPEPSNLDALDREILRILAGDCRLSVRAIARQLEMSAGAISERIARLEETEVVLGYHAAIDQAKLGYGLEVIVGLQTQQGPALADTLDRLMAIPEVEAIHVVTGQWDLVLRVVVRDHQHLQQVVLGGIWQVPGFTHSETMIVYETRRRDGNWNVALRAPSRESRDKRVSPT